jgi:hypothetical protein
MAARETHQNNPVVPELIACPVAGAIDADRGGGAAFAGEAA